MKCDNCKHDKVCKFKEEYEAATKRVMDSLGVSGPLSVEVKCEHFASVPLTLTKALSGGSCMPTLRDQILQNQSYAYGCIPAAKGID